MSTMTMNGEFGAKNPIDRSITTSKPVAEAVAEPVKETKMENVAAVAVGTPIGEKLGALGRAVMPPVLGLLILLGIRGLLRPMLPVEPSTATRATWWVINTDSEGDAGRRRKYPAL